MSFPSWPLQQTPLQKDSICYICSNPVFTMFSILLLLSQNKGWTIDKKWGATKGDQWYPDHYHSLYHWSTWHHPITKPYHKVYSTNNAMPPPACHMEQYSGHFAWSCCCPTCSYPCGCTNVPPNPIRGLFTNCYKRSNQRTHCQQAQQMSQHLCTRKIAWWPRFDGFNQTQAFRMPDGPSNY